MIGSSLFHQFHFCRPNLSASFVAYILLTLLFPLRIQTQYTCRSDDACGSNAACIRGACTCFLGYAMQHYDNKKLKFFDQNGNLIQTIDSICTAQICPNDAACVCMFGKNTRCVNQRCICNEEYFVERISQQCVTNKVETPSTTEYSTTQSTTTEYSTTQSTTTEYLTTQSSTDKNYPTAAHYKTNKNKIDTLEIVGFVALLSFIVLSVAGLCFYSYRRKTLTQSNNKTEEFIYPVRPAPSIPKLIPKSDDILSAYNQLSSKPNTNYLYQASNTSSIYFNPLPPLPLPKNYPLFEMEKSALRENFSPFNQIHPN